MTDTPDDTRLDEIKAKLRSFAEELKAELATLIDQKLDELGAIIGGE